jgi:hypothetical protein
MAFPLPEVQQWFPDWDGSDSEDSVRSTIDEVADHSADEEAFANLPLTAHYAKNIAVFQEVLRDEATVTIPVYCNSLRFQFNYTCTPNYSTHDIPKYGASRGPNI